MSAFDPPPLKPRLVPANPHLERLRKMAWFLDRSIPLGGGRRTGVDPVIGLAPGIGDWLGAALSLYVLYQAARLGLPWRVLGLMAFNVIVDALVGTVPVAGDLFDFIWQVNMRNLRLVEAHYTLATRPRSFGRIGLALILFAALLLFLIGLGVFVVIRAILGLFA